MPLVCGVSQASFLGPLQFSLYMPLLVHLLKTSASSTSVNDSLPTIIDWLSSSFLPLSTGKSEILAFHPENLST